MNPLISAYYSVRSSNISSTRVSFFYYYKFKRSVFLSKLSSIVANKSLMFASFSSVYSTTYTVIIYLTYFQVLAWSTKGT